MRIRNCPKNLEEASYNCLSILCVFGQKRDFETLVVLTVVVLYIKISVNVNPGPASHMPASFLMILDPMFNRHLTSVKK